MGGGGVQPVFKILGSRCLSTIWFEEVTTETCNHVWVVEHTGTRRNSSEGSYFKRNIWSFTHSWNVFFLIKMWFVSIILWKHNSNVNAVATDVQICELHVLGDPLGLPSALSTEDWWARADLLHCPWINTISSIAIKLLVYCAYLTCCAFIFGKRKLYCIT